MRSLLAVARGATSVVLLVSTTLLATALPAAAQYTSDAGAECDALAASPADSALPPDLPKVEFVLIDADAAIAACTTALEASPDDAHLMFQLGRAYDRKNDQETAIPYYRAAADAGYAAAMRALAILYANGEGVEADPVKSAELHQQAIDAGSLASLVDLGWSYYSGLGVEMNLDKTVELFNQAVDAGLPYGMSALAYLYESGLGVEANGGRAGELYRQAAEANDPTGALNLGYAYSEGKFGYSVDYDEAVKWFESAAEYGSADAMFSLSQIYRQGLGVTRSDTKASEWLDKAAAIALPSTMATYGSNFAYGLSGAAIDLDEAVRWYNLAIDGGYVDAYWALARLYYFEPQLEGSERADDLFESAFELGGAIYGYHNGSAFEEFGDFAKALDWYERAGELGDSTSLVRAGSMLWSGSVITEDRERATTLFEQAAADGSAETLLAIGYAVYYGDELGNDYVTDLPASLDWMQRAADAGSDEAASVATDIEDELASMTPEEETPTDDNPVDETPPTGDGNKGKDKDSGGPAITPTDEGSPPAEETIGTGKDKD